MRNSIYGAAGLAVCAALLASTGCDKLAARDEINRGIQEYKSARYPQAIEHFKAAVARDPSFVTARVYLATAYMAQYIPGAESEENVKMAKIAEAEFLKVLDQEPGNSVASESLAYLYFQQKKFEQAAEWYQKVINRDPKKKEAYYTLGVIAWTKAFQDDAAARAKLGMRPEDPGPLKDKKVRDQLREKNLAMIESGIQNLNKALEVDSQYDDAMAYLNLLYRQRADLQETEAAYNQDTETANNWVEKTLNTKKAKTGATQ